MIPTLFLDWGLSFGAGLLFGVAGRREIAASSSRVSTRAFRSGLVFLHAGVIAVSVALYAMNPAWMWMYWVDPRALPVAAVVLAFALYELCYLAGFFLASEADRRRPGATWAIAGCVFVAITLSEVAARVRLFHFGTFDEFAAGRAPFGMSFRPFRVEPEMWVVLGPGVLATIACGVLIWRLARDDARRFGTPNVPVVGSR